MSDYWKDNNIEKPQQVVVCAACTYEGLILCGARHWDSVMRAQYKALQPRLETCTGLWEQGFIDQFGDFLTREEAMRIAIAAKQKVDIKRGCGGDPNTLYSEGLY